MHQKSSSIAPINTSEPNWVYLQQLKLGKLMLWPKKISKTHNCQLYLINYSTKLELTLPSQEMVTKSLSSPMLPTSSKDSTYVLMVLTLKLINVFPVQMIVKPVLMLTHVWPVPLNSTLQLMINVLHAMISLLDVWTVLIKILVLLVMKLKIEKKMSKGDFVSAILPLIQSINNVNFVLIVWISVNNVLILKIVMSATQKEILILIQ